MCRARAPQFAQILEDEDLKEDEDDESEDEEKPDECEAMMLILPDRLTKDTSKLGN